MQYTTRPQAILLLADGTIFYGKSIGISGTTFGEVCFNTGMTGYQEIFTDPSYFGQIMVGNQSTYRKLRCQCQRSGVGKNNDIWFGV